VHDPTTDARGEVTDVARNTFLIPEGACGKLAEHDAIFFGWWASGDYGDTVFTTLNLIPDRIPEAPPLRRSGHHVAGLPR
jgi:hypothetical protein